MGIQLQKIPRDRACAEKLHMTVHRKEAKKKIIQILNIFTNELYNQGWDLEYL